MHKKLLKIKIFNKVYSVKNIPNFKNNSQNFESKM